MTPGDETTHAGGLVHAAGAHARALAAVCAHTAAGLVVIADVLEISDLPAVHRSVQRERGRAALFRALERDLQQLRPDPATPAVGATGVGSPPKLEALRARAASGDSGWLMLIALRQWNLRQCARRRTALGAMADELIPWLQAHADPHAQAAASRLPDCVAASPGAGGR